MMGGHGSVEQSRSTADRVTCGKRKTMKVPLYHCDQIGQFIGLRATFKRLWQQLICLNLPHSQAIFVKVSKSLIFLVKSSQGNFYIHLAFFSGHTALYAKNNYGFCTNDMQCKIITFGRPQAQIGRMNQKGSKINRIFNLRFSLHRK